MSTSREPDSSIQDTSGFEASRSKNTTQVQKANLDSSNIEEGSHGTRTSQSIIGDLKKEKDQNSSPNASAVIQLATEDKAMEIKDQTHQQNVPETPPKPVQEKPQRRIFNTQVDIEPSIACVQRQGIQEIVEQNQNRNYKPQYGVGQFGYTSQYDHFGNFSKGKYVEGDSGPSSRREEQEEDQQAEPANRTIQQSIISTGNRRAMTAPYGQTRRKLMTERASVNPPVVLHQPSFIESDLLKAANIYQQFDKKGNLFENRLYAKTSINQAKLSKDQETYDKKMESHPDEMCRINNQVSAQNVEDLERSMRSAKNTKSMISVGRSNMSQSMGGNQNMLSKSQTAMNFIKSPKSTKSEWGLHGGQTLGGTFTKANGPKLVPPSPAFLQSGGLYQRIQEESNATNRSTKFSNGFKSAKNVSFQNVQKSLHRLSTLGQIRNGWSLRDQLPGQYTVGVGGKQNTFRNTQNLFTNDPSLFKEKGFNTNRPHEQVEIQKIDKQFETMKNNYFHYDGPQNTLNKIDLNNKNVIFETSKVMNQDGKMLYSRQLEKKGASRVSMCDKDAAGIQSNKIQKKAYRANTQSRQTDGLYKDKKFSNKPALLNHTRENYNILMPHMQVKHDPAINHNLDSGYLVKSLRSGNCHQVYGISDFSQNTRSGGIKYHEKFQSAFGDNNKMFRRTNGEFTTHQDQLKWCKF